MSEVAVSTLGSAPDPARVSFDQLDTLVRVTTIRAWVYLATLFAVCAAAVVFAVVYRVPIKVNGEGILLIASDTLSPVRAEATGRLVNLWVKLGDQVVPGDEIGEISQEELKDTILEAKAKRADLEREDQELTQFEHKEKQTQDAALARVSQAIQDAQDTSRDKLRIAEHIVTNYNRLRAQGHIDDMELLETREKLYLIRDDLNKGQSRLRELELEGIKGENARRRAQIDRKLKIGQLDTKLALDRGKLARTSRVVSRECGEVTQVLSSLDELVREGAPIVLLHAAKTKREKDDTEPSYDSIIFVPAGEGKKIEVGHAVEVSPATVKREEHGFIRGDVVAVSELPVTKLAMEAALEHPELVDSFLKRYAPGVMLRVQVKLRQEDVSHDSQASRTNAKRRNPFRWSSPSGSEQTLKTGTMCQAAVVVKRQTLISLVLPLTKTVVGVD